MNKVDHHSHILISALNLYILTKFLHLVKGIVHIDSIHLCSVHNKTRLQRSTYIVDYNQWHLTKNVCRYTQCFLPDGIPCMMFYSIYMANLKLPQIFLLTCRCSPHGTRVTQNRRNVIDCNLVPLLMSPEAAIMLIMTQRRH